MSTKYIHLANLLSSGRNADRPYYLGTIKEKRATTLETFWNGAKKLGKVLDANPDIKIFLDSGAYSLMNQQAGLIKSDIDVSEGQVSAEDFFDSLSVNDKIFFDSNQRIATKRMLVDASFNSSEHVRKYLDDYIEFIHKYKDQLLGYVNLDIIYSAEESYNNQLYMESNGLKPIPVFHYGEDFKWFKKYVDNYEYIGLGGLGGGITTKRFIESLGDRAFTYIAEANPDIKVHGFAVTSMELLLRYPWYSCDSTTWLKHPAYGKVIVPKYHRSAGRFDYSKPPSPVSVSDTSYTSGNNTHYTMIYSKSEIDRINEYFSLVGVTPEELETSFLDRTKVSIYFFEHVLKEKIIQDRKNFKPASRFF